MLSRSSHGAYRASLLPSLVFEPPKIHIYLLDASWSSRLHVDNSTMETSICPYRNFLAVPFVSTLHCLFKLSLDGVALLAIDPPQGNCTSLKIHPYVKPPLDLVILLKPLIRCKKFALAKLKRLRLCLISQIKYHLKLFGLMYIWIFR